PHPYSVGQSTYGLLVWDRDRARTLFFGGTTFPGLVLNPFTSEWDGAGWLMATLDPQPSGRNYFAGAYDAAHKRTVIFGGTSNPGDAFTDTWFFDGATLTWSKQMLQERPSPRWTSCAAYDAAREVVVLFGGYDAAATAMQDDTWLWNGSAWTEVLPAPEPSP